MNVEAEHTPQRHATRAPVDLPLKLHFDDSVEAIEGRCTNISIGGMFLTVDASRPPGTLVRFELSLEDEDDTTIRGLGEVVWMRARAGGPERQAGMGLKFRFLEQRDRQQIFKLVSEHIKKRLADRHGSYDAEDGATARDGYDDAVPSPSIAMPPPVSSSSSAYGGEEKRPAASKPASSPPPAPPPEPARPRPTVSEALPAPPVDPTGQARLDFDAEPPASAPSRSVPSPPAPSPPVDDFDDDLSFGAGDFDDDLPLASPSEPAAPSSPASTSPSPASPASLGPSEWDEGESSYSEYLGDDHFDHRPAPRNSPPWLPIAAIVVVVLAALLYFFWGALFGGGDDVDVVPSASPPAFEDTVADDTVAENSASGDEPAPVADPPPPATPDRAAPPPPPAATPPASPPQQAPPPPSASSPRASSGRAFSRINDIEWRTAGSSLVVVVTTDGDIPERRFDRFRLENPPREVVRLYGLDRRYATREIAVGRAGVERLRTGWHQGRRRGNEQHLVFDLAAPSARVTSLRAVGDQLVIEIAP